VNVASYCALTPQYPALEKLYETFHDQGLEVIGVGCNQFGGQEPVIGLKNSKDNVYFDGIIVCVMGC